MKVRIVWNGQGGELDSVTVMQHDDYALTNALIKLVQGNIVAAGDLFVIEEVQS